MRRVAYIYKMLQIIGNAYKLPGKERKGKKKAGYAGRRGGWAWIGIVT